MCGTERDKVGSFLTIEKVESFLGYSLSSFVSPDDKTLPTRKLTNRQSNAKVKEVAGRSDLLKVTGYLLPVRQITNLCPRFIRSAQTQALIRGQIACTPISPE